MRRNEKILFEIDKRKYHADCPFDYEDGFKRGVEWADKNPKGGMVPVDKVWEWLYDNFWTSEHDGDYNYGKEYVHCAFNNVSEMHDDFRKIMEE